ncbi:hypothetical protein B0J17DRAFT_645556 [Rhizoctonia solani]|nr:hypothetical protein B0J17DRAFT_645556 [Rhizoctonia solani]
MTMAALTPCSIASLYEPVPSGKDRTMDSLDISDKTNIELRIQQFFLPTDTSTLDSVTNPHQQTVTTELALSGSPLLDWQLVFFAPAVCPTSLGLQPSAWLEQAPRNERSYTKGGQPMKPSSPLIPGRHVAERSSINSNTTRTTDSSYVSFSADDTTSLFADDSCPRPPRASMMMDPLSQALLDKKLRKIGGWKSRLLNVHSSIGSHLRRSAMGNVLDFVRDDLMLCRGQSRKTSCASSNGVVTPPIMSPIGDRFTK